MTNPPAGWYTEVASSAEQRYWDGTQWTGHRQAGPVAFAGGGSLAVTAKRHWDALDDQLRLVVVMVGAAVALMLLIGLALGAATGPVPEGLIDPAPGDGRGPSWVQLDAA